MAKHPESRESAILERVSKAREREGMPPGWSWPWGWWVKLWEPNGTTHVRHLSPGTSYIEAAAVRDEEMRSGRYEKAWMGQKTRPTNDAK